MECMSHELYVESRTVRILRWCFAGILLSHAIWSIWVTNYMLSHELWEYCILCKYSLEARNMEYMSHELYVESQTIGVLYTFAGFILSHAIWSIWVTNCMLSHELWEYCIYKWGFAGILLNHAVWSIWVTICILSHALCESRTSSMSHELYGESRTMGILVNVDGGSLVYGIEF